MRERNGEIEIIAASTANQKPGKREEFWGTCDAPESATSTDLCAKPWQGAKVQ